MRLEKSYTHYSTPKDFLDQYKKYVLSYLTYIPTSLTLDKIVLSSESVIDVFESEKIIIESILNNPVATNFLLTTHSINDIDASLPRKNSFINYDILKDVILNNNSEFSN